MKYLIAVMFALLVLLVASLWTGHGSYPAKWQLEKEIAELDKQNEHQEELNRQIRAELEDAQSGSDAVEERARSELGMIRNQETFFEVILEPTEAIQEPNIQNTSPSQIK
jgi:cell division protein FtsB